MKKGWQRQKIDWRAVAYAFVQAPEILTTLDVIARVAPPDERGWSPKDLAERLNLGLSHVSYYVRRLHEAGVVEQTAARQARGAIQHYYRVTPT
jgi:DNA-binding MarR family transcriptional regulator